MFVFTNKQLIKKFTLEQAMKVLDGGGWLTPCPGRFTPGKGTRYPSRVGPRSGVDGCGKSRPTPGFDPRAVQSVASRYTDHAIPAHINSS